MLRAHFFHIGDQNTLFPLTYKPLGAWIRRPERSYEDWFSGESSPYSSYAGRKGTESGVSGTVNVKVSAVGDIRPAFGADGKYALTSGGGFSGKTVTLTADAPKWAKSVTIVDGNIVLSVKPKPMVIVVR